MSDPEDVFRLGVRVPRGLRRAAQEAADAAGMSLAAFVLEALLEHLARCEVAGGWIGDGAPPGKQSLPPTTRKHRTAVTLHAAPRTARGPTTE